MDSTNNISSIKLWLFKIIAIIIIPLLFFLSLEGILQLTNFGYNSKFTEKCKEENCQVYRANLKFGWPYYSRVAPRFPQPFAITKEKPQNTYRIFILGGSAAAGFPNYQFGFSRILEVMLRHQYPDVNFEVINTAFSGVNSHVVFEIAKETVQFSPDLFIIYMGHNEAIGPYGPSSVFAPFLSNHFLIRASIFLNKTKTGQLLEGITSKFSKKDAMLSKIENEEFVFPWLDEMYKEKLIEFNDPKLLKTYQFFHKNLKDTLKLAGKNNIPVVLTTVASNLKDWAPFSSKGEQKAIGYFSLANDALKVQAFSEADQLFRKARDLDALVFRAQSPINTIIRSVAEKNKTNNLSFIDLEKTLSYNNPLGIVGHELLMDYVHPNFDGHYIIAKELFTKINSTLPNWIVVTQLEDKALLTKDQAAQWLALSGYNKMESAQNQFYWFDMPPFTYMSNHPQIQARVAEEYKALEFYSTPEGIAESINYHKEALKLNPNDKMVHFYLGKLLVKAGQPHASLKHLKEAIRQMPEYEPAQTYLKRAVSSITAGD